MALKREYGGIQPCIRLGIFRIRIPFIHFNISGPEVVTGLMNACTSYGALAVLIQTLGLDPQTAYALVLFETACYTLSWLLGEPAVCGWITAAMAIIILYLETLPEGVVRFQALTCIQLELGILFIVLGALGISKKLNMIMPPALKGGIVLGAGINSVVARLSSGGAVDTATIACLSGLTVVLLFMFSQRIRYKEAGQEGMNSIYDGTGTNLIFTVIGLFFYPLYEVSLAASSALLVVVMVIQGFVCAQIAINLLRDDMDKGITGLAAGLVVARGAAIGLPVSIIIYLLLCNNEKIKMDYNTSKEELRLEEEETARQLEALQARMASAKAEHDAEAQSK